MKIFGKDKNKWGSENALLLHKSRLKTKSKILVFGLVFVAVIGVGFFGTEGKAQAYFPEFCFDTNGDVYRPGISQENCLKNNGFFWGTVADSIAKFGPGHKLPGIGTGEVPGPKPGTSAQNNPKDNSSTFAEKVSEAECGLGGWVTGGSLAGCLLQFVYYTFYMLGSLLLWLAALLFNFLIIYTIDSELLRSDFISSAWATVRDLSNIFFILILLYIAIKIILDIGGSEAKKMIAKVIIIALLVNFSMFFTRVIIDSSNILALIFYNRIKTENTSTRAEALDPNKKKDLAGGLTKSFNPAYHLKPDFFENAGNIQTQAEGMPDNEEAVSIGLLIGITIVSGTIMLLAAYALFISGLSFLGRLIELFILIIFSPFAFVSSTIPFLSSAKYLGWDNWFKRLLEVAFMAPIFMFFLYFIFLLLGKNPFVDVIKNSSSTMVALLNLIIPALIILILLNKATKFAKKGSGEIGEAVFKGAKIAGGVALMAATGGAAIAGTRLIGGAGGYAANKAASIANRLGATKIKNWNVGNTLGFNKLASGLTSVGAYAQRSSFDIRGVKIGGKTLASATGLKIGEAQKGGIEQRRKEKVEKDMKRANLLNVREDEKLKQALNKTEDDLQSLLNANSKELNDLDKLITARRQTLTDANAQFGAKSPEAIKAGLDLNNYKNRKKALKTGQNYAGDIDIDTGTATTVNAKNYTTVNAGTYVDAAGVSRTRTIDNMEDFEIRDRKQDILDESRRRKVAFAKRTARWGRWSSTANKEAKHKIIMESKIESKA